MDPRTHQGGKLGVAKGLGNLTLASLKTKPAAPAFTYLFQIQSAIFSVQVIIHNSSLPMFLPYLQPSSSYFPHSHLTSLSWHSKPYFPEFPGSAVVWTQHFCCCGLSSIPSRETKISQVVQSSQKQTNKTPLPPCIFTSSLHYPLILYPGLLEPPEVPSELCSPTFISQLVTVDSVNSNTTSFELVTPSLERTRTLPTPPSEFRQNELLCVYLLTCLSPHWTMLALGPRSPSYSSLNHQHLARAEFPESAKECEVEIHPEYPS